MVGFSLLFNGPLIKPAVLQNKTTLKIDHACEKLHPKMTTEASHVKRILNFHFIVLLLQFTNNAFTLISLSPNLNGSYTNVGVENTFHNSSTAAVNGKAITKTSTGTYPKEDDLLDDGEQVHHNGTNKLGSDDSAGLKNTSKSLQLDLNKEKETAHIHIYTGLWFILKKA